MKENREPIIIDSIFVAKIIIKSILAILIPFLLFYFWENIIYFWEKTSNYFFKDDNAPKGELLKVFLTFVAGIIAVLVWHTSYRRAKATEKQMQMTEKQMKMTEKNNTESYFNNTVMHLSNENPTVVLSGIHVLHQIAVENKSYAQIVHNLFCSFLRENSAKLYDEKTPQNKCPIIIQTLIDYLFSTYNCEVYKNYLSDLSFSTLKNCNFKSFIIDSVNFSNCLLENCDFNRVTNCNFEKATLTNFKFWLSTLTNCNFEQATLTNCDFWRVTLTRCRFAQGILRKCNFRETTLKTCEFLHKKYIVLNAKLYDCKITDIELIDTELPLNEATEK